MPPEGYARRKRDAVPSESRRTPATLPKEDHMAFSAGYRLETTWFQGKEVVTQRRKRNMHCILGPNNMSPFDRHQMCMNVISWILYLGSEHQEFDVAIKWLAEFLKYLCGYTTLDEEDWLDTQCNSYYIDLTTKGRNTNFTRCSKTLSRELRHCSKTYLFDPRGGMNIVDLFDLMEGNSPKRNGMTGAQFAAFLLCNPKQRFFVGIYMQWEWYPYSSRATYPFDVRLSCTQGHSNEVVGPWSIHHPLTYDEAMCLGWIFHATDKSNMNSIQRYGLKTKPKRGERGGRDAAHFMYHNDNGQGYIRMAEGTTPPRHYRQPSYLVLDPEFLRSQQLFLAKNGVIFVYDDIPSRFLHQQDQLPTLACNVLTRGRGHMLPPSVTGGTWPADASYEHVRREKGISFVPGGPIPDNIRTTAWQFMGQEIPQNYGRLVFGLPLAREADFDPKNESIHALISEGSQQREESEKDDQPMGNPYEQPSRRAGSSQQREEPADQWEQQRSSSGSSEPPTR